MMKCRLENHIFAKRFNIRCSLSSWLMVERLEWLLPLRVYPRLLEIMKCCCDLFVCFHYC